MPEALPEEMKQAGGFVCSVILPERQGKLMLTKLSEWLSGGLAERSTQPLPLPTKWVKFQHN